MSKTNLNLIAHISLMTALAVILDKLVIYQMPQGGGISLVMLPILLITFQRGLRSGLITGLLTGTIQLLFGGYFLNIFQVLCDYLLAYAAVGLAGVVPLNFKNQTSKFTTLILGGIIGGTARLFFHTLSGIIFYADYAPEGTPVWLYSLTYNTSYLIPSTILALVLICILSLRKEFRLG